MGKFVFNKSDEEGEYVEFSYPVGPLEVPNIEEYRKKFSAGNLSRVEKETYYNYLLANVEHGTAEEADEVYKIIMSRFKVNEDVEDIAFLGLYTLYLEFKKVKYDEEGNIRKGYEEFQLPSLKIYKSSKLGGTRGFYQEGSKKISIVEEFAKVKNIMSSLAFIYAICHEARHYTQEYEMEHGILNESSFAFLVRDKEGKINYWNRTVENDANEHAYKRIFEIFKKYFVLYYIEEMELKNGERISLEAAYDECSVYLQGYEAEYESLLKNKKIAFATMERGIFLTDVSDIGFILNEAKELKESKKEEKLQELYDKLSKLGAIPKIYTLDSEGGLVLQSEENLLEGYFSANEEEKIVYEKALKYIYTYEGRNKSDFVHEDSYYKTSELKLRFIKEQLVKEQKYLEEVKKMTEDKSVVNTSVFSGLIIPIINEIIDIRLQRIKYYSMITSTTNSMLHAESNALLSELKELYLSLMENVKELGEDGNIFRNENSDFDYSNKL